MFTFSTYTLGCKVSQYETEAVSEGLLELGFSELDFGDTADVYIINTCTVTAEADAKCRKYIRRAVRQNPGALIAVMGCYSQRAAEEISAIDGVSIVLGTAGKMRLVSLIDGILRSGDLPDEPIVSVGPLDHESFEPMQIKRAPRTRAYVKIEDGCECKCSYCAIAAARGPVRSKPMPDVIREVEALAATGVREVVLTGIETGSYGIDLAEKTDLGDLICELDRRSSCERIRLGSLAPELIGEKFVEKVKNTKILAPHFHLSMQSGSDKILRAMRRRYNTEGAMRNIEIIRKAFPRATFTTDLMVGFPGESEEDFSGTLDFVRRARFLDCHVFAYSRREGTPAASYENQIPEPLKAERSRRLIAEKNRVRDLLLDEICVKGEPFSAIFETKAGEYYTGHSDTFVEVKLAGEQLSGEMISVKPTCHKDGVVFCERAE